MVYTGREQTSAHGTRKAVDRLIHLSNAAQKIRMNGSAALDICQVACGVAMLIWSLGFTSDYAAAGLIAEQAGAILHTRPLPHADGATAAL